MNSSNSKWPYSELAKFEVVALGCHRKLYEGLSEFFNEKGIGAFQLVEYFLREPVGYNMGIPAWLCFPFLRRLLDQNIFHLKEQGTFLNVVPLTQHLRNDLECEEFNGWFYPRQYVLPFSRVIIGQSVLERWRNNRNPKALMTQNWFEAYSKCQWEKHEDLVKQAPKEFADIHLIEFDLVGRFWKTCRDDIITFVGGYPICSKNTFYGYFVIVWPEPCLQKFGNEKSWGGVKPEDVAKYLDDYSKESYVPTLALLHNSFWEEKFNETIKNNPAKDHLIKEIDTLPINWWSQDNEDLLEHGIAELWKKRRQLLGQPNGLERVKETLLFRKYNIASPGMVKQIKEIIQRSLHFCQPDLGDKLPAALVYGEAGSGKDTMAKLIQLFTPKAWESKKSNSYLGSNREKLGYFGTKSYAVNMSALKPNALFGPLFQGVNVSNPKFNILSILTLFKETSSRKKINGENYSDTQKKEIEKVIDPVVFILDELNSLDVDLQGVLLRILENGEVIPLFDITPSHVKHLIIGVVNEDPEILMRENETKYLEQIKGFAGHIIANVLYEFFIKGRRLRPDLFYRLSRGLYVKLPSLRERRDDIPILFYFECEAAVKQELKNTSINLSLIGERDDHCVCIEMKAYDILMDDKLDWPGNIRQLQAVATKSAQLAVKEYIDKDQKEKPGVIIVRKNVILKALNKQFPDIFI